MEYRNRHRSGFDLGASANPAWYGGEAVALGIYGPRHEQSSVASGLQQIKSKIFTEFRAA